MPLKLKLGQRTIWPRLHYAEESEKRSFISTLRPTVRKRSVSKMRLVNADRKHFTRAFRGGVSVFKFFRRCVDRALVYHKGFYYMEESVLLETKPLVDSIRHFIRDPSGVFSVCHLCECHIVQ